MSTVDPSLSPTADTSSESVADMGAEDRLFGMPMRSLLGPHFIRGLAMFSAAVLLVLWPDRTDRVLGLVLGIACVLYATSFAVDLARHRERRTFFRLAALGVLAGLGTALISQPEDSLTSAAQAGGLALLTTAAVGLVTAARSGRISAWTVARSAGFIISGGLLLRYPEALLVAATSITAGVVAATGFVQVFARPTVVDPDDQSPAEITERPGSAGGGTDGPSVPGRDLLRPALEWIHLRSAKAEDRDALKEKLYFEGIASPVRYARFLALMAFASVIASVGVMVESTAVVIGAMLIAPLMVPLMGTAFATVMGWPRRMARCGFIALTGIVLAIGTGALVGSVLPRTIDVTTNTEVLARISPTAVDLVIAVAAGAAGAFAMARRDVSDSLPGVAVAIALVPPLAVVGLCWEQQAWESGNGALLLFLTNAVAILVAGGATFVLVGAAPLQSESESNERVSSAVVALLSLAAVVVVLLVLNGAELARADVSRAQLDEVMAEWSAEHAAFEVVDTRARPDGTIVIDIAGPGRPPELGELLSALHDAGDGAIPVEVTWVDRQQAKVLDD